MIESVLAPIFCRSHASTLRTQHDPIELSAGAAFPPVVADLASSIHARAVPAAGTLGERPSYTLCWRFEPRRRLARLAG
jgi:hypothetical protein